MFTRDRLHEARTKLAERIEALKALDADPTLGLRGRGVNELDAQPLGDAAELGQAVAALRLFGVDPENAVLIRIEGQRQAVRQHVRLQRLDSGESRDPKASSHDDHQFESPPHHHPVPANRRGFLVHRNSRNFGRLARRSAVCEPNSGRPPAFYAGNPPPVSARKIRFPGPRDGEAGAAGPPLPN